MREPQPIRRFYTTPLALIQRSRLLQGICLFLLSAITFLACLAWQFFTLPQPVTQQPGKSVVVSASVDFPTKSSRPASPTPAPEITLTNIVPPKAQDSAAIAKAPQPVPNPTISPELTHPASPSTPSPLADATNSDPVIDPSSVIVPPVPPSPAENQAATAPDLNAPDSQVSLNAPAPENPNLGLSVPNASSQQTLVSFVSPASYTGKVVRQVAVTPTDKVIALTFDDGPWPWSTPKVLDILKQHQIKATFFWIGLHLEAYPKIAKQVVQGGHAIGNHTWHHRYHVMTESEAAAEIDHTAKLMETLAGVKTTLFRPPGGRLKNGLADYAEKTQRDTVVLWSVMPADTNLSQSAQNIVNKVLKAATPGGIVLLHDGGGDRKNTVEALPKIIAGLEKQGYRFVTIPELLERSPAPPAVASLIGDKVAS